ncbi:hypothetical protein SAMN05444169_2968 [Bradyrhizobium erythrophlei]|uniref:Uncharacterized protein n=1 Tax=Bradyrhizobium erythrophlei TaxID=1437360 RepID=A0A1M5KNC5_9BRAD|nr:hypothetical protein SAMN05444169_2968 [Bradyrhizobium erythrophlei]
MVRLGIPKLLTRPAYYVAKTRPADLALGNPAGGAGRAARVAGMGGPLMIATELPSPAADDGLGGALTVSRGKQICWKASSRR